MAWFATSALRRTSFALLLSTVIATTPVSSALAQSAVRYYPGKDVVIVTVVETVTASASVEDDGTAFKLRRSSTTKRDGSVVLKTVADTAQPQSIDLLAKGLTDTSFAVELTEDSLLKSVNLSSSGRFGDILMSVAKFAGAALAVAALATGTKTSGCNGHAPDFAAVSTNGRYFIEQSTAGCALATQIVADQRVVTQRERELHGIEDLVVGATATELPPLQRRLTLAHASLDAAAKALTARTQAFATALTAFEQEQGLGNVPRGQTTRTDVLQMPDLPPTGTITEGMTLPLAQAALAGHPTALATLDRLKVAITLEPLPKGVAGGATKDDTDSKTLKVCFRQSVPLQLRVFLFSSETAVLNDDGSAPPTAPKIRLVSTSIENILHADAALTCPTFKTSAFSDRKLALAFDSKGRPQKIEREGKSDAAAIAAGVAGAASAFLSATSTSLAEVEKIQTSRRSIGLGRQSVEAERLKREKAVTDAQLAAQGATATFDSALKQQKLQADLNALNAEIQLATAEESRAQKQEIERLKLAVEQVKQALELVKAEQDLAKLRK
jgi:hypothetical protein